MNAGNLLPCLTALLVDVPGDFNFTCDKDGAVFMYAEGDISVNPRAKMSANGYFFDAIETCPAADYDHSKSG